MVSILNMKLASRPRCAIGGLASCLPRLAVKFASIFRVAKNARRKLPTSCVSFSTALCFLLVHSPLATSSLATRRAHSPLPRLLCSSFTAYQHAVQPSQSCPPRSGLPFRRQHRYSSPRKSYSYPRPSTLKLGHIGDHR
jgi:hypothetical protein